MERSFSQMKIVKTRLRNRLSYINLARHMRIVIEGPELTSVNLCLRPSHWLKAARNNPIGFQNSGGGGTLAGGSKSQVVPPSPSV